MAVALGKQWDGSAITRGAATVHGPAGQMDLTIDHFFTDIFDTAQTRFCLMAPEKRAVTEDMAHATQLADGGIAYTHLAYEEAHKAVRALAENSAAEGAFTYVGFSPTSFRTGSIIAPLDPHASPDDVDGI